MVTTRFRLSLMILLVLGVGLACDLGGMAAGPPPAGAGEQAVLQTMVAVTLTAVAGEQASAAAPAGTPQPEEPFTPPRALQAAYLKDGNVYVWTEGEGSLGLTGAHDAVSLAISEDGQRIAYLRQDPAQPYSNELWVVNTSGPTEARLLVGARELSDLKANSPFPEANGLGIRHFTWRPRTHQLAYGAQPVVEGIGFDPAWDLRLVHADTLEKRVLFDFEQGGAFYYSPDGRRLALVHPGQIDLCNADGSDLRREALTYQRVITYSEYSFRPFPAWAQDSRSLRVAIPPQDPLGADNQLTGLWMVPVDGSPAVQLAEIAAAPFDWMENAFSPGLDRIAFVRTVGAPEENLRELYLARMDGSGDTVFAAGESLTFLHWTPDGERFVYQVNGGESRGLYLGSAAGGSTVITSAPETVQQMRWVDSSRFIYLQKKQNSAGWELRISDVDGTGHAYIDSLPDGSMDFDFTK